MLNFIYYPVSGILWFWHKVFGYVIGANNGFAWALAVVFLVATLRALLIKPFVGQVRSMRKMQEFQPQIKKLQEKYKNDKQKLGEEMQKLQKEHGVNPLNGCLPVFVQIPVFVGLFHVLRGFQPSYPYNYVFDRADILSFLDADILGVRLSDSIGGGQAALGHFDLGQAAFNPSAIAVCLPLMIISSVATHFTARVSQRNQSAASAASSQAAMMGKVTMWLFPIGILVFGAFFPVAILLYWLSNNTWTLAQQHLVYKKINQEETARREEAREHRDTLGPKVGQKPVRGRESESAEAGTVVDEPTDAPADATSADAGDPSDATPDAPVDGPVDGKRASGRAPGKVNRSGGGGAARGSGSRTPGKVANGQAQSGQAQSGQAQSGQAQSGQAQNGQKQNGQTKSGQGKGSQPKSGKKKGQLASSGRSGKRKK